MKKLHLISQSIELKQLRISLSRFANEYETLLFIGESVTSLLDFEIIQFFRRQPYKIHALSSDCTCRGISDLMADSIIQVSDNEMVNLTLKHQQTISW